MYSTIKNKYRLLKYKAGLAARLKYFYCSPFKSDYQKFRDYIKLNIRKLKLGYKLFDKVTKGKKTKLNSYNDLKKLEFEFSKELVKNDLFLYPSYIFYANYATVILTYACNYRCDHCYQTNFDHKLLELDRIELFIDKLKEVNIRQISFFGGEVFLYMDHLCKAIKLAQKKGMRVFGMTTNGFWCNDPKKAWEYMQRLKDAGYNGFITISIGIGHRKYGINEESFLKLKDISKDVFGWNVFDFQIEEVSRCDYEKSRKKFSKLMEHHQSRWRQIIPIGAGKKYKDEIIRENKGKFEYPDNLYCTMLKLLPDERISFCAGPAVMKEEYTIAKLSENLSLEEVFMKEHRHLMLLKRFKGKELYDFLIKEKKIEKEDYPFICHLCVHLSKNPELVDFMYEKMIKNRAM
ncbi:TPA: radical SAM protein [Candidatus Woesearchaeota archaeon]|nr:Radical SAM superfamily protein [archaeon GW2011_AR15]MBS3103505.1 radical SAM protein [Candidatus Woesearchaeota archaeon]HIH41623.1 radical SAM protein [Candidatus Woesearchaeota archaeon]